jgi:hypothetical protein
MSTPARAPNALRPRDLSAHLNFWVAEGLITAEQSSRIQAAEAAAEATHVTPSGAAPAASAGAAKPPAGAGRRIPLLAEAVGYLGAALAVAAAVLAVRRFWPDLDPWAQLTITGAVAALLWAAGLAVPADRELALARLASLLWFGSTAAVAAFLAVLGTAVLTVDEPRAALLASAGSAAYAVGLWRRRPYPLQQVAAFAAVAATALAGLAQFDNVPGEFFGLALWAVGAAWLLLGWAGAVWPRRTAYAVGAAAVLYGPLVGVEAARWAIILGVLTAVALLVVGGLVRSLILLGFGTGGVAVFVPIAVIRFFGDTLGAPLALFVAGVALVGFAVLVARFRTRSRPPA